MNFLYPQFLFGLLAIAIPVIIHLFNFHKPKKILFTNVKFLKAVKENTSSRLKLKHILILISRICFIIFLVLTFAQPFIKSKNASLKGSDQIISTYLDNSFSMQNELEKEKIMDIGIKSIIELTDLYPSNAVYYFLTNDFEGKDQYFRNKEKLNERLAEVKFSNIFREADVIYNRQIQTIEKSNKSNHIFWFSDFQKSTIGNLEKKIPFDSTSKIYLIPIQNKESQNLYIDSLWLGNPMVKANENNNIEFKINNDSDKDYKDLILKLYIDDVQVSSTSLNVSANSFTNGKFVFNLTGEGQKRCKITFEDFPVTFDNQYYFVLNVSPKIKILHLYQNPDKAISNVFNNETVFSLTSSFIGDFDYSLISISNFIILDGLNEIPSSLEENLKSFIKRGGSLVIFPSENFDIESYNRVLSSLYIPKVNKIIADTHNLKVNSKLLPPDIDNPFFKGFYDSYDKKMDMPFAYPIMEWTARGETLLRNKAGNPFYSLFYYDQGKVYLSSTPLNNKFTNFTNHSLFVLVMYKTAFNSIVESERLAYSFQEPTISLDVDLKTTENVYTLASNELQIIPGQRIIGRKLILDIPKDQMKAGFYELKTKDGVEKLLAFNYGKEESKMKFYSADELKNIFSANPNVQVYNVQDHDEFIRKFKNENIGQPLWKFSLILCLIFLAIEILLIRFL
jgi:hypothetical protein